MSRIKYLHVIEVDGNDRQIRPGKGDPSGSFMAIPTPDNDREDFERLEWERVGFWSLPESMPKSKFKDWWNDAVNSDGGNPDPIPDVLDAMDTADTSPDKECNQ